MFERFAQSARAVVEDARYEAERRGDRRIGTEHLLLALLQDTMIARAVGADADEAREAADELDRKALAEVGIDVGSTPISGRAVLGKHVPFTSAAKTVMRQTLAHATAEKARTITPQHMVQALLDRADPDPAAAILTALSVDRAAVRRRLSDAV